MDTNKIMKKENIIKTIEIEIGDTIVKVTPEQLVNLHSAISELLNLKTEKIIEREVIRNRYPIYPQPTILYWNSKTLAASPDYSKFDIKYNNGTNGVSFTV